ncbi:MAG: ribonuclease III [Clostridia bacterium]|nr:ribonuclease III [Clostridia bacterium]
MDSSLNSYSSASLAYLGDCAIEICVREYLVSECGFSSSAKLNKAALDFVRAPKQAEAMKNILPLLTEEEEAVFHRGRNIGHTNTPKSATVSEYRAATGMEALFGYLWLAKAQERMRELFRAAYRLDEDKNNI